jgi:hypothetical protein
MDAYFCSVFVTLFSYDVKIFVIRKAMCVHHVFLTRSQFKAQNSSETG